MSAETISDLLDWKRRAKQHLMDRRAGKTELLELLLQCPDDEKHRRLTVECKATLADLDELIDGPPSRKLVGRSDETP